MGILLLDSLFGFKSPALNCVFINIFICVRYNVVWFGITFLFTRFLASTPNCSVGDITNIGFIGAVMLSLLYIRFGFLCRGFLFDGFLFRNIII